MRRVLIVRMREALPGVVAVAIGSTLLGLTAGYRPLLAQVVPPAPQQELVRSVERLDATWVAGPVGYARVRAEGTVREGGYSQPRLVPLPVRTPPPDGIYEFSFTVVPPVEGAPPAEIGQKVAVDFDWLSPPPGAVGVRLRAAANLIEVRIGGDRPAFAIPFDPATIIGKRIVSGRNPHDGEIDRAAMPANMRLIRPDDSLTMDYQADRLTVIQNSEGIILNAYFG